MSIQVVSLGITPVVDFESLDLYSAADISLSPAGLDLSDLTIKITKASLENSIHWNTGSNSAELSGVLTQSAVSDDDISVGLIVSALRTLAANSARLSVQEKLGLSTDASVNDFFSNDDIAGPSLFPGTTLKTTLINALNEESADPLVLLANELATNDEAGRIDEVNTKVNFIVGDTYPFNALIINGQITLFLDKPELTGVVTSGSEDVNFFTEIGLGTQTQGGSFAATDHKYAYQPGVELTKTVDRGESERSGLFVRMAFEVVDTLS
jgi:hypothetical protein